MWTRKELKQRGKQAFSLNYWKTVLIALLITALAGGASVFLMGRDPEIGGYALSAARGARTA